MAIFITDDCINCGACETECPNNAIYEGNKKWKWSDGTNIKNKVLNNKKVDINLEKTPYSKRVYYIVSGKCTECKGFYKEPQCVSVCPVNCCLPDKNNIENNEELLKKKYWMHN